VTAPQRETDLYLAFMGYADTVADRLVSLYAALSAGLLSTDEFVERAALLVGAAQARMFALADVSSPPG
jgi:hypothetical protein